MKNRTLMTSMEQVIQAYHSHGFKVRSILGYGQFKHIQQPIEQKCITLTIFTTNEHIPEIER